MLERNPKSHCLRTCSLPPPASILTREQSESTPKLISFGREYIDPRGRCAVSQKYKWKRTSRRRPRASTSDATRRRAERRRPHSMGTRDRAYSLPGRRADQSAPLSTCRSERASERAHSHGRPLYHFRYRVALPHGSPFSPVVEPDSLCALHNLFCNSTLRAALTGTPTRHPHSEMGCVCATHHGVLPIERACLFSFSSSTD